MLFQKLPDLLPERHLVMMLRLALNISRRVGDAGDANAKGPVTLLPFKIPMLLECVMQPLRGIAFEKLDGFAHGKRCGNGNEDMHMILHATGDQQLHFILARDTAKVRPEALLNIRLDERAALLGGPHAMHQTTGEGMHGFELVVFWSRPGHSKIARQFNREKQYFKSQKPGKSP